ncbi:hypothetical protein Tco_0535180 [Tanacetum coccineum]
MTELTLEEFLCMCMAEIAKRYDENTNLIKEIRASMDFALRNQEASIKALEIHVRHMSINLHEKLSRDLRSSTKIMPNANDETISTSVEADMPNASQCADELKETNEVKDLEAYYTDAKHLGNSIPR